MATGGPIGNPRIPRMQRGGIVAGTSAQAGGINIFLPPGNNQPRDFHRNYLGLGMTRAMVHGQLMDTLDAAARKDA